MWPKVCACRCQRYYTAGSPPLRECRCHNRSRWTQVRCRKVEGYCCGCPKSHETECHEREQPYCSAEHSHRSSKVVRHRMTLMNWKRWRRNLFHLTGCLSVEPAYRDSRFANANPGFPSMACIRRLTVKAPNHRRLPGAVKDRDRPVLWPVQTQHDTEFRFGSGQPIRLFVFAGRIRLEIDLH